MTIEIESERESERERKRGRERIRARERERERESERSVKATKRQNGEQHQGKQSQILSDTPRAHTSFFSDSHARFSTILEEHVLLP